MIVIKLILLFFIYATLGWTIEVLTKLVSTRKFINRGFLIGPYCPIYGIGGVVATLLLTKYKNSFIITFIASIIIFGSLEYFTSYLMEKLFKARWWDYSTKKYNINGRVCLETLIPFGILGCTAIYIVNPILFKFINRINPTTLIIIVVILSVLFIIDFSVSLNIISGFKKTAVKFVKKDNTEEITKKVKETLISKSKLNKRLVDSFPKFKSNINQLKEKRNCKK